MVALETLRRFDESTAAHVLAAAALTASGSSDTSAESKLVHQYGDAAKAVLAEIRRELHVEGNDTPAAKTKVERFLTDALRSAALGSRSADEVLSKAGTAGHLPPSAYSISFTPEFTSQFRPLGMTKRAVEECIKSPFDYQHLMVDSAPDDEGDLFSLFIRRMNNRPSIGPYWSLTQTTRRATELIVQSIWWVHPDKVDLSKADTPLDVLRAFAETYGLNISVERLSGKFLEFARLPKKVGNDAVFTTTINSDKPSFHTISFRARPEWDYFDIGIAYAIDLLKYQRDIRELKLQTP